jgi:hypothetical protein
VTWTATLTGATMFAVQDNDTMLWRATGPSGRILECVVRFARGGVEVEVRSDGRTMIVHRFATGTEATAWAEEVRQDVATNQ